MKLKHDIHSSRTGGAGSARLGPATGHPWLRGPLFNLVPEGGSGGGGTGQPPPGGQGGGAGGDPPKPAPAPGAGNGGTGSGERTFTQAELDRIVADRVERAKKSGGQQQPPAAKTELENNAGNGADASWVFDLSDAMDSVLEETGVRPTVGAKKKLRADFQRDKPQDAVAYVKTWFTDIGLVSSSSTPNNKNNAGEPNKGEPAPKGNVPPISDKGPPNGGPREFESITNPNDLTTGDYERLVAKHGEAEANRRVGAMASRWLKTVRIKIGPKKGNQS